MTIGDRLSSRDNALNFVRLGLATAVIISHTWAAGGYGHHFTDQFGSWAVDGFFAISGYLIAGSRMRSALLPYLWRRALRIFPAFWVCLIGVAFVFAPIAALITGDAYQLTSSIGYVLHNAALYITQPGIDGTLSDAPYVGVWNGPLWTLFFEFSAYIIAGLILTVPMLRKHGALCSAILLALITVIQPLAHGPLHITDTFSLSAFRLGSFFAAGMLVYFLRNRIRVKTWLAPAAAIALAAILLIGQGAALIPLPYAFLVIWVGAVLPVRIGSRNDISYGLYIWAFPVQQLIIVAGLAWLGPWGTALLAFILTVPLAWASWRFIEKPALRLARLVPSTAALRLPRRQRDPDPAI